MKLIKVIILSIILTAQALAQDVNFESVDLKVTSLVEGTLLRPADQSAVPLVIIIQGSGPTDRDGNQPMVMNNSLKYLAQGLSEAGIASFRYDKRIMPMLRNRTLNEATLSFNDFVDDAKAVLKYFQNSGAFSEIHIAGHSQGSLVGMLAAQEGADGFISLAGAGQSIDEVIIDQLERQAPGLAENAQQAFTDMRTEGKAEQFSPGLASIFRKDIQPFMLSWMQYDPKVEIAKLSCPVLIVNGNKDLQVDVEEAQLLAQAKPDAQFAVVENMNHVLKFIEGSDMENAKSYNEPNKPLSPGFLDIVVDFVNQ
ncbi:alpha/beta hydrolase [Gilvibacter sp. SZ-19]|uniref:alpha/beta hydrolase family protein n=1 Tax=Gilvibacter sp. SZ-19 TaxID=754429 RepID=UPI000B3D351D|nr:alpha/beta fold hydrolase [Gilvibacter sp. SZ-19]ARV11176.1 alpha/beta hydrolase [Gilvibacter sp. SZ-19]